MNYKFIYKEIERKRLSDINLNDIPQVLSKSQWKKMIKKGVVFCNGEKARTECWVKSEDEIEIKWVDYETTVSKSFPLKLDVIYEDDVMAIVNKPPGLPVSGNVYKSLQNALSYNLQKSEVMQFGDQFQTCHRLDYSTSGLVVISKTKQVRKILGQYFEDKTIQKYYYAIVQGRLDLNKGDWKQPVNGKDAFSTYRVLTVVPSLKNEYLSLVELSPKTGRTHQLRIHSAENGHCIVGDTKYGNPNHLFKGKGLFLTAYKLQLPHPITKQDMEVSIDLPNKFDKLLKNEERRFYKHRPKD